MLIGPLDMEHDVGTSSSKILYLPLSSDLASLNDRRPCIDKSVYGGLCQTGMLPG